jgi:hypothetical protein
MYMTSVTNLDVGDNFAYMDDEPFVNLADGLDTLTEDEFFEIDWHEVLAVQVLGSLLEITWKGGGGSTYKERVADWVNVVVWEEGDY